MPDLLGRWILQACADVCVGGVRVCWSCEGGWSTELKSCQMCLKGNGAPKSKKPRQGVRAPSFLLSRPLGGVYEQTESICLATSKKRPPKLSALIDFARVGGRVEFLPILDPT